MKNTDIHKGGTERILIYKRTHRGDPNTEGQFGINGCMGSVRSRKFDAVIGIGGTSGRAVRDAISQKVNWIGIGAQKHPVNGGRHHLVTFDHFVLFEEKGKPLSSVAPALHKRMYLDSQVRWMFSDSFNEFGKKDLNRLLKLAAEASCSKRKSLPTQVPCDSKRCLCSNSYGPKQKKLSKPDGCPKKVCC